MALMATYTRWPITLVKGEGAYVWDDAGRQYLDFTAGIGVVNVGHCHPHVVQALEKQAHQLWHVSNLFTVPAQEELAARLTADSHLDAAFFCNSGAEANEAAIKLARKVASERKGIEAPEIVTFTHSFHGRTLATLTATGQEKVKQGFAPLPSGFETVLWGDAAALAEALKPHTAAVMLEVVQGEGGLRPADSAWLHQVAELCRARDVLLIVDEVQTGMGRTGTLFAHEMYDFAPDIVTLAKGLGNGFPIGCTLATKEVAQHFGPGSHGSTFGGNPLAMASAHAVLDVLTAEGFLTEVKQKGEWLKAALAEQLHSHPLVADVRGHGLMLGIALREPRAAELIAALQGQGMLVLPAGADVVRLLPPLVVTEEQLKEAVDLLKAAFADAVASADPTAASDSATLTKHESPSTVSVPSNSATPAGSAVSQSGVPSQ
ncbi:acetylornithine transaminase [Numidum massiliense]|uniref:acetylornithine transaminase n=1 Tax=Numidum massiliense TaxID=1522315 RepID=UPI00093F9238|nr:acetylornithine transaminase [Numidum massiliense]